MKPKLRRELVLMVLSPIALLGAGWWFIQRDARQREINSGPLRISITQTRREPVNAFEAARGFDTKVVAQVQHAGVLPGHNKWHITSSSIRVSDVHLESATDGKRVSLPKDARIAVELEPDPLRCQRAD